jgi:hypothetical protein
MTKNYYPQTVSSWQGAGEQKLINKWGRPDQTMALKDGNTVLVYRSASYRPGQSANSADCTAMFEINKQQVVVHTQYQGKRCWRDQGYAQSMSNHS